MGVEGLCREASPTFGHEEISAPARDYNGGRRYYNFKQQVKLQHGSCE
jgi:hypothetical protein